MSRRLVLVHGLGQAASSWDKTVAGLTDPQDTICPNLATLVQGKAYSYENLYRAFSAYCHSQAAPANLCGLSLGAVLALNYALDNPERVSSLVLVAPQYKMPKTLLRLQNVIFRLMPNAAFEKMGFGKYDFINLTKSMLQLDFSKRLKDVSCPTLVLYGEKDRANRRACEQAAARIPNAQLACIPNAGHEVNVDEPEKLAAAINCFADRLSILCKQ